MKKKKKKKKKMDNCKDCRCEDTFSNIEHT